MSTKIDPGYGYRLLMEGETMNDSDEYYFQGWHSRNGSGEGVKFQSSFYPTRRAIDADEGWRLVGENELILREDDFGFYYDSELKWNECHGNGWADEFPGLTPKTLREKWSDVAAVRRKIEVQPSIITELPHCDHIVVSCCILGYAPARHPFIHPTEASAIEEAQRLAGEHGGKFVVFRAVKAFERGEVHEVAI